MKLIKKNKETTTALGVELEANASNLTQGRGGNKFEGWNLPVLRVGNPW